MCLSVAGVHLNLRPSRLARGMGVSFETVERRRGSSSVVGLLWFDVQVCVRKVFWSEILPSLATHNF